MKRTSLIIFVGIVFIIASLVVIAAGIALGQVAIISMANPFLFTGIIILYSGIDERKIKNTEIVEPQKESGKIIYETHIGKRYTLPFFLILFGTIVMAIVGAVLFFILPLVSILLLGINFLYGLILNIYFIKKLGNKEKKQEVDQQMDELAFKVAFFFASLATGGLFAIGYLIYKKLKKS